MATFEQHIEGLTQIDIDASSSPTTSELTEILVEGLIHTVNTITTLKPQELPKFTNTTNSTSSVTRKGKILSVLREHDSTDILRICTPINPSLRYEATNVDSLHYRSKYNPGYYELDGLIHCIPAATGSGNNDIVVVQVDYDTGLTASDNYNAKAIDHFPLEYEYLLGLYGAAMACNAKANDINNNMPTNPVAPTAPNFTIEGVSIPDLPHFSMPAINISLSNVNSSLRQSDLDKAEKQLSVFDKELEIYNKQFEDENTNYKKELEIFKSELENASKNADRKTQVESAEYSSEIEKYKSELQLFQAELQEAAAQYKWYTSQYITFMNQYNTALGIKTPKPKQESEKPRKESK